MEQTVHSIEAVQSFYESVGWVKVMNLGTNKSKWYPVPAIQQYISNIQDNYKLKRSHGLTSWERAHNWPEIRDQADIVISQATFYKGKRASKTNISAVKMLCVDVDYKNQNPKLPEKYLDPLTVFKEILPDLEHMGIIPTYLEYSRNFRLIYVLDQPVKVPQEDTKRTILTLLERITVILTEAINSIYFHGIALNAEPQKLTAFVRLPGTINSKDESLVHWVEVGTTYTFEELEEKLPPLPAWYDDWKARKKKRKGKKVITIHESQDINKRRLEAFKVIAPDLPERGCREKFLHLVFQQARVSGATIEESQEIALGYNELLRRPLPAYHVMSHVRTNRIYKYKDQTIQQLLGLSPEYCERKGVFNGMDNRERKRRYNARVKAERTLNGQTKAAQIQQRMEAVKILREAGQSWQEVADRLGVSLRTAKMYGEKLREKLQEKV